MSVTHSTTQIAKRYAKALFSLAGGQAAALMNEVAVLEKIARLPDVNAFFHNPLMTRDQQAQVVKALLEKQKFSSLLIDAVVRIAKNRRLVLLPEILAQFREMVMAAEGIEQVDIVSAKQLSDADVQQIANHLSKKYNKKIHADAWVDASLIGGIMLKMQDKLIDYSVAGKLSRLQQHLKSV